MTNVGFRSVPKETVYHILVRLNNEAFLTQYNDLNHTVTLQLTEKLMKLVNVLIKFDKTCILKMY